MIHDVYQNVLFIAWKNVFTDELCQQAKNLGIPNLIKFSCLPLLRKVIISTVLLIFLILGDSCSAAGYIDVQALEVTSSSA